MHGADFGDAREARLELRQFDNDVVRLNPTFSHDVLDCSNLDSRVVPFDADEYVRRRKVAVHERKLVHPGKLRGQSARDPINPACAFGGRQARQTMDQEDGERHHAIGRLRDEEFTHAGECAALDVQERTDRADPPAA